MERERLENSKTNPIIHNALTVQFCIQEIDHMFVCFEHRLATIST